MSFIWMANDNEAGSYYVRQQAAKYCSRRVCMSVFLCLFACISQKPNSRDFLYVLHLALVRPTTTTVQYVIGLLLFLWMTSCHHIMEY